MTARVQKINTTATISVIYLHIGVSVQTTAVGGAVQKLVFRFERQLVVTVCYLTGASVLVATSCKPFDHLPTIHKSHQFFNIFGFQHNQTA